MKKTTRRNDKLYIRFIYLFVITCIVTGLSMAKYQSIYTSSGVATIASWNIKINDTDITLGETTLSNIITLVPEQSDNVADGKMAPGYGGHFDIVIDPAETEVSLDYTLTLDTTQLPTDVVLLGYGDANSTESTTTIENNTITGEINIQNSSAFTSLDAQTIRVFWMWNDVRDNDSIHTSTAVSDTEYKVGVEITVTQKVV